jgi:hypothetical protein
MTVNHRGTITHLREYLKQVTIKGYPLYKVLEFIGNLIVIPAFTFQILKIIKLGRVTDFSKYFILLQLIGTPEGGGGLITGIIQNSWEISLFGGYGLLYYLVLTYFYLFPRKRK